MANRKHAYADIEKWRKTKNEQKKRYYRKTAFKPYRLWIPEEESLVMKRHMSDMELSKILGRSVSAIQKRRFNINEKMKKGSGALCQIHI